ncbi:hypothetical protein FJY71_02675 [candidate division WOR-3 bacterium]|nr:hypothetical protein [candidate division WOR-3 bacterium]
MRFDSPGPTVLEAAVESLPAEENHADNRRSAVLDVRRSRLRAAYLTNRPGSGTRFVLAALRADSRLDVSAFVGGSDPGALRTLAGADMFVIDAWAEQGGAAGPLAAVEARVRAGAGALVLAGPGFRPGEMLGRMLPAVAAGAPDSGVFTPVATSEGTLLPWFTPGTGVDLTAVPPFRGTAGAAVKPQVGTVWLECAETGEPLLVTGRFGRGRVAYVAGFPLWRWGFLPEQVAGGDSPLAVFLHGVARFLGEADTGRFVLETDKPGYMTGEPIRTRLLARAADGTGWEGLAVTVSIDSSAAGVPMVELGQGRYEAVLQSDAGEKTVTAAIVAGDSAVGGARARVTVVEQSVELGRLGLDAGRLRAVAAASGGRYFPPDSLPRDGSYLRPATFRRSFALDPRRSSWAYVTVALLAGLEIALRRRKGLL